MAAVLIPVDGSEPSNRAIEHVRELYSGDALTFLHVIDPGELVPFGAMEGGGMIDYGEIHAERYEDAKELLERARQRVDGDSRAIDTDIVTGRVPHTIVRYADEHDMEHIVIGSHGRSGANRLLLGSVAETVARRSSVPVTVVP